MNGHVRYRRDANGIVFSLEGEIDLANADAVEAEIRQALGGEGVVVIDLTRTEYLDSAGLRLLFALARSEGGRLSVVIPEDSPLRRVVTMVGLSKVVPLLSVPPGPSTA